MSAVASGRVGDADRAFVSDRAATRLDPPGFGPSRVGLLPFATWIPILDGDPHGAQLYERHYSSKRTLARRRASGARLFLGPGEKLVLMTPCQRGLFAWRWAKKRADGQTGIECAVFRNEGAGLSSILIRAADAIADARWPGQRHFTYVNPREVANSNAGRCFYHAGWRYVRDGKARKCSSRGLFIMEREAA